LLTLVIADVDTLIIDPCDEDSWDDIEDYFDCIWDEYEDCPWDTAGLYIWGIDGREYVAFENTAFVGINELQNHATITSLYPNPAVNNVNVIINAIEFSNVSFKIYDINGQELISNQFNIDKGTNHLRIDLNDLATGVYQVYLFDGDEIINNQKLSVIK